MDFRRSKIGRTLAARPFDREYAAGLAQHARHGTAAATAVQFRRHRLPAANRMARRYFVSATELVAARYRAARPRPAAAGLAQGLAEGDRVVRWRARSRTIGSRRALARLD